LVDNVPVLLMFQHAADIRWRFNCLVTKPQFSSSTWKTS